MLNYNKDKEKNKFCVFWLQQRSMSMTMPKWPKNVFQIYQFPMIISTLVPESAIILIMYPKYQNVQKNIQQIPAEGRSPGFGSKY